MDEYITKKAAINAVENAPIELFQSEWEEIEEAINAAPVADVVPVVHGRWDDSGRYTFPSGNAAVRCTNCGCALTESEYRLNNWNYCPVCGAKMDGGTVDG